MARTLDEYIIPRYAPFVEKERLPAPTSRIEDAPYVCVKINESWIPYLVGALETLAYAKLYFGAPGAADWAAHHVREIQSAIAFGNMDCEGDMLDIRQSPIDPCVWEKSYDAGATWVTMFDTKLCAVSQAKPTVTIDIYISHEESVNNLYLTYNHNILNIAPDWGYGDEKDEWRNFVMCFAVRRFVSTACEILVQMKRDNIDKVNDVIPFLGTAIDRLYPLASDFVRWGVAVSDDLIGDTASAYVTAILADTDTFWALNEGALGSDTIREEIACAMYAELVGLTPTFANWSTSLDEAELSPEAVPVGNGIKLLLLSEELFAQWFLTLGAAIGVAEVFDLPCPCDPGWEWILDLSLGKPDWVVIEKGTWIEGQGVAHAHWSEGGWYYRGVKLAITYPKPGGVLKFRVNVSRYFGSWQNPAASANEVEIASPVYLVQDAAEDAQAGSSFWEDAIAEPGTYETSRTVFKSSRRSVGTYSGSVMIKKLVWSGQGINPFI